MGADISCLPVADYTKAFIAVVIGSMDAHPSRYIPSIRIQKQQEIIQDLTSMIKELLIKFYKLTTFKPERIIYYRNHVSEEKSLQVLCKELLLIRTACLEIQIDYQPGVTFITAKREHHTRLFCAEAKDRVGKSGNIPAGTIVDKGITHPTRLCFYLSSHNSIQGTSCPTCYHVLWDDNHFSPDEIQCLTNQLCYTYARCTKAVSLPAPLYYAKLVANHSRYHLEQTNDGENGRQPTNDGVAHPEDVAIPITVHNETLKLMYYA